MESTIDMKDLRYLNLFTKITKIQTRYIFSYNETIYFCVPKNMISRALGRDFENLRRMSDIIRRRVKVIPVPLGIVHAKDFIRTIVEPATFKDLEITATEIVITAGNKQNKATLLGRNKKRLSEMQKIVRSFFNREYRVV